jgi:low temperature requirement protein LtrA
LSVFIVEPLRLRSIANASEPRKVTWLELFFDLIFVAAVAQVAQPLRDHYAVIELFRFTPLFVLIWWAWTGHAVFSTRFDSDDVVQRGLTLMQMFAVAAMAANAKDALDSRSSAGFAAAYAGVRFVLVAQYFRARHVPDAKPLTTRYLAGHGSAAILWLLSALVPAPTRFLIWVLAFAIDFGTPWIALRHSIKVPPDASHLPERFGLFTLILLGEWVVAVMQGMESQEDWPVAAATSAFLGMGVSFLIWWWYFDGAGGASEQHVRSRRDARRFHAWTYAHFPLYLGVVVTGVGVQRMVTAAARATVEYSEQALLTGAATTVMAAMIVIASTSGGRGKPTATLAVLQLAVVLVVLLVGLSGRVSAPLGTTILLAAGFAAGLSLSLKPHHARTTSARAA